MEGMVDIHCHILPGVDDGAERMEEALRLLHMEREQGVGAVILTPHYRGAYFETPRSRVREVFRELQEESRRELPDLELYLGCEFHSRSDGAELIREEECFRMAGTRYVLLEFSGGDRVELMYQRSQELRREGFRPVIAHAERYPALERISNVQALVEAGAYIQLNAGSVTGENGWRVRGRCRRLLKEELVHFVASDAHDRKRRRPDLARCAAHLERTLGAKRAEKLLVLHPRKLLRDESI